MKIGSTRIHLINDGTLMVDGGDVFGQIPKSQWELYRKPDRRNRVVRVGPNDSPAPNRMTDADQGI